MYFILFFFVLYIRKLFDDFTKHYEVEYVINFRQREAKNNNNNNNNSREDMEYFVKWKGFAHRDNTWVKFSNFDDSNFVEQYHKLTVAKKRN